MKDRLTVFISYSWDDEPHKEWVLKLANYLIQKGGINVFLDQYELSAGRDLNHFMEQSLERADKVLIILTENYKIKADNRQGGTGFEYSIISQNLFEVQAGNNKFLPILRSGSLKTSAPVYLKTKVYHPMINKESFEVDAYQLLRLIYEKPELVKPELGPIPNFKSADFDPIIDTANRLSRTEQLYEEIKRLRNSVEGVERVNKEVDIVFSLLEEKAKEYSQKTDFTFHTERDQWNRTQFKISIRQFQVDLIYRNNRSDAVTSAYLKVQESIHYTSGHNHFISMRRNNFGQKPEKVYSIRINDRKNIEWQEGRLSPQSSQGLVQEIFVKLIQAVQEEIDHKKKENRL